MFRAINEYLTKVNLQSNDAIYRKLYDFWNECEGIKKFSVTQNFNRYIINVYLEDFSIDNASEYFETFWKKNSYPYSSLHVRFNEGKCVRYRFVTSKENKDAFYCDLVFN